MKSALEHDLFFDPGATLEEGFSIKRSFTAIQIMLEELSGIAADMIEAAEALPSDLKNRAFINSCCDLIGEIRKYDFEEYGNRVDKAIKTLDEDLGLAEIALKKGLESSGAELKEASSILESLTDSISYQTYSRTAKIAGSSSKADNLNEIYVSEEELDEEEKTVERKFREVDEMNTYLNFLMQGEHESASYFARREEYKKKILDKISKGEEALIELPNGMHVTFYPMPASFRKTVYIQDNYCKQKAQKAVKSAKTGKDGQPITEYKIAQYNDIYTAMLPYEHLSDSDKYQFIDISKSENISVGKVKELLSDKNDLDENAEDFYTASKVADISVVYLISHARYETDEGADISRTDKETDIEYFDYYGYGAYDDNTTQGMIDESKRHGWLTKRDAIIGGTKLIKNNYVEGRNQKTRYTIRYNPNNETEYQYASDIDWPTKQVKKQAIIDYYNDLAPSNTYYRIPYYSE